MNVLQEAYGLLSAWLISLDYPGSTCIFCLSHFCSGAMKNDCSQGLLMKGILEASVETVSACPITTQHWRGEVWEWKGEGDAMSSRMGDEKKKKSVCMCAYASKSSSLSTGHRYTTQILNQLCSYEIHVNWNTLIANQFTKSYFKALLLWYTLLRVNALKPLVRALIERHYTGSVKAKIWVQYKVSSSKQYLWHNADYHKM